MSALVVLKFGGSFLRGPQDLVRAVHAVYAEVRAGRRVIAVTSAFHGRTDALEASLRALDAGSQSVSSKRVRASLLATGEAETATLLTSALERSGVPARHADVRRFGPFVAPGTDDPVRLDAEGLLALFDGTSVVCIPGFAAVEDTPERDPALLGRGGSDMTAVFLGATLGARVVLVKDVEGLYTADPARREDTDRPPRRLARVSFDDALRLGDDVLQGRALRHAAAAGLGFEVVGPGHVAGVQGTRVGRFATIELDHPAPLRPLRVALLGLGTVGARVFAELSSAPDRFEVASVLVRDLARTDRPPAARALLTDRFDDVLGSDPDLVIEATSGAEPAAGWIAEVLRRGVHVVTANKAAAATARPPLEVVARASGAIYLASAAVGGALPALETIERAAALGSDGDRLVGFEGVLNGTSNAVLTAMAEGASLVDAVKEAQALGLAEADPTLDLDGTDVAHKLELLARAAGWVRPGASELRWIAREGIDAGCEAMSRTVRDDGKRLRLVGAVHLTSTGPVASVSLRAVDACDPLFGVSGPDNALVVYRASGRAGVLRGRGAGSWPTATAVMGDVYAVARRMALVERGRAGNRNDHSETTGPTADVEEAR